MFRIFLRVTAVSLAVFLSLVGAGMFIILPALSGGVWHAVPGIAGFVCGPILILFILKRCGTMRELESDSCQ